MVDVDVTGLPAKIIKSGNLINIASEVKNKSDPCGYLTYPFVIIVLAKPDNTKLPAYMPVGGATVRITYGLISSTYTTDQNGIAIYCRPKAGIIAGAIQVKKDGVDFGNGDGVYSDYENLSIFIIATKKFIKFSGTIKIPCPTTNIQVTASNFDKLDIKPNISTQPLKVNYAGYGAVDVGGAFRLYVDEVQVGSGTIQPGSGIDKTFPTPLKDVSSLKDLLGKSVKVRVEIDHGTCTFSGERTVSLPALPITPTGIVEKLKGIIKIPSIPKPLKSLYPVKISIGGKLIGEPPIEVEVDPGKHNIVAELKNFTPISKSVTIKTGETLTIIDIAFAEVPELPPEAGEFVQRVGLYCTIEAYQKFNKKWYRIIHDTKGELNMGIDSLDKAISKAPADCFKVVPAGVLKGIIKIPSIPKPLGLPYPVNISIDGILIGEPPITEEVDPGKHNIVAELKNFTPISKSVTIKAGETLTITDIAFIIPSGLPPNILSLPAKPLIPLCGNLGDVNGDGVIDGKDAVLLAQYTIATATLTEEQLKRADVRGTGTPNITDALFIAQYVKGDRLTFPGCAGKLKSILSIPSVPKPLASLYPVKISIDGKFIGEPPITEEVDPGQHNIVAELKNFTPISKSVTVKAGETLTITDMVFAEVPEVTLGAIIVLPSTKSIEVGSTTSFAAKLKSTTGKTIAIPTTIIWESSKPDVGIIDPDTGVFTAVAPGTTKITATSDAVSGKASVIVTEPPPEIELGKTVKILVYPVGAPLKAFDEQEITITAAVMCGVTPSSGENATLLVDGIETAFGTTSGGFVSFKWTATTEPSKTHKICVNVPKSSVCDKFGAAKDCKTITVSRVIPEISEQLLIEREAYLAELEAKRAERAKIRELALLAEPPGMPSIPSAVLSGSISIPSVPKPPASTYPINISIDGVSLGEPPIDKEYAPGAHTILVKLKNFTPISRKVYVKAGETLTITDIAFE